MPKDKIDAAIKRGVEGKDGERRDRLLRLAMSYSQRPMSMLLAIGSNAESVLYEASGPAGSAFMVRAQVDPCSFRGVESSLCLSPGQIETLTDNKRRTAPALRHILGKHNGSLGTNGSVAWMFDRKGYLEVFAFVVSAYLTTQSSRGCYP